MPIQSYEQICSKCFKPKEWEFNPKIGRSEIKNDIGSIIILYPNGQSKWVNVCEKHIKEIELYSRNGAYKFSRQVELQQTILAGDL